MRQIIIFNFFCQFVLCSCNSKKLDSNNSISNKGEMITVIELAGNNSTPTVELVKYTLIGDDGKDRKHDAEQILKVKRKWPLAMQSKNPAEFDSILSKGFTFKGINSFYNREEYIKDRTNSQEWIITFVKYENVTLQFIGNMGILSYVNVLTNKSLKTGDIEYEHISWVDIYVEEEGKWKIGAAHAIDYRLEIPSK